MASTQPSPVVSAPCGRVQGFKDGPVHRYTGIPYATAERFQVPIPAASWPGLFDATRPVPSCPQPDDPAAGMLLKRHLLEGLEIDEHCQGLSITVPADIRPDEQLSVMVWFHGGAFANGAGDAPVYNPARIVSENRVIVVNVTSRLNIFGFLGDGSTRPANLGLLDILESLRWVKKNIAAFGGNNNPKTITIFGQSAGGSTVSDLMAAKEAPTLFGRVIVQSAPFGITRGRAAMNKALFELVKDASASLSQDEMVQLTTEVLKEGQKHGNTGAMPFAPQYGFAPLPDEEDLEATLDQHAPDLDILVGCTANETSMFVSFLPIVKTVTELPLIGWFAHRQFVSWSTWMLYTVGANAFVQRHLKAGGKASSYIIKWGSKNPRLGAMHAGELALLLGQEKTWAGSSFLEGYTWDEIDQTGKKLRKLWADFAKGKQLGKEDSLPGIIDIN